MQSIHTTSEIMKGTAMQCIDVYDFDGTIYRGDSTVDFLLYLAGKRKSLLLQFFPLIPAFLRLLATRDLTRFKSALFRRIGKTRLPASRDLCDSIVIRVESSRRDHICFADGRFSKTFFKEEKEQI